MAEIRKRVIAIVGEAILVDPEAAWGEVLREIRRVGTAGRRTFFAGGEQHVIERQFSSPFIAQAADAIGWADICQTETDDLSTVRAQFRQALKAIQEREVDRIVSGRALDGSLTPLQPGGDPSLPEAPISRTSKPQPWLKRIS